MVKRLGSHLMNLHTLFFLLVSGLPAGAVADGPDRWKTVDLLIVAGQSNAVGFDASPVDLPEDDADQAIMFWWKSGDPPPDEHDSTSQGKWTRLKAQPLGDPIKPRSGRHYGNFAQPEGGFGPEMSLARTIYSKQRQPLAVLKIAFSGTGMRTDWNPADDGDGGRCYRALVEEFTKATKVAEQTRIRLRPRALFWVQGESDANADDAPKYADALGRMIARLRADIDADDLPAFIALNTKFSKGANKFVPGIVEQQKELAARDSNIHYVDTSAATTANYAHLDAAGTLLVGQLFANRLLQVEEAGTIDNQK